MTSPTDPSLLTRREAARLFGVGPRTIDRWVVRGLITPLTVPGSRRIWFRRDDLLAALIPRRGGKDVDR